MKKIKVLHVCNELDKGGLEEVIYNLVKNSNNDIYDVRVAFFKGGVVSSRLEEKGFKCYEIKSSGKISKVKGFMKLIKVEKIDIVQAHFCFSGILAAKFSGVKVIETVHNTYEWFKNPKGKFKYSFYLNLTDVIVSVSNAVNKFNLEHFNITKKNKCKVITNSIDSERITPTERTKEEIKSEFSIPNDSIVISSLSRIDRQKGLEYFIEAAKKLNKDFNNLVFLIPGTGEKEYTENLKKLAANEQNIIFTGHISKVNELFKIMDIYVMSSLWEGAPLTLLEAMAYGKAIVVTKVGNTSEVINDGENGYLIEKKDIEELYNKISLLIKDSNKRNSFEKKAKQDFNEKYSNEIMISQYQKLYSNLF